jgi:hypothetical protein
MISENLCAKGVRGKVGQKNKKWGIILDEWGKVGESGRRELKKNYEHGHSRKKQALHR